MKIASSSRCVVLNQIQWFILVTFKSHIPNDEVYDLGDLHHTLSMHCGLYIRIMSEDVQVFSNKSEWSDLMELASTFMGRQILKLFRLHDDLIESVISVTILICIVKHQTQMSLISKYCTMN